MTIHAVELRRLRLPFRTGGWRHVLVVRVVTGAGEGWGECAALHKPTYTSEYVDGAAAVLRDHLVPRLAAAGDVSAAGVSGALVEVRGHRMARAALEMALLDAELRASGVSLASYLGATRSRVDAGVVVRPAESIGSLLDAVARAVDEGFRRVKLKIGPGWDLEPVRAVRAQYPDLLLQADTNGAYTPADAGHLAELDPFDLAMLEQPVPAGDLLGAAEVARRIATPVCLDESITSAETAAAAIALGAAEVVNIKPGRVGGYLEAKRVHDTCVAAGVPAWCGGMWETGLARSANLAVAALPGCTLPGDLCPPARYLAGDLVAPLVSSAGSLVVPDQPGIGADVLPKALDEFASEPPERLSLG